MKEDIDSGGDISNEDIEYIGAFGIIVKGKFKDLTFTNGWCNQVLVSRIDLSDKPSEDKPVTSVK